MNTGTANVTIPAATPLDTYFVLACADDRGIVAESDEANNCVAAPGSVTVTRPDLVVNTMSAPPATAKRGGRFTVTDAVQNPSALASGASRVRYYLSLDPVKGAGDVVMSAVRNVPVLAAGATHGGTVTVTVPTATPFNTYFVLACADGMNAVAETDEANNCRASGTKVTVMP